MSQLNDNIRELRKAKHLTLEELADKVGTSRQNVHRYETGEVTNIPYDKIILLANALGVTPGQLMGFDENGMAERAMRYEVAMSKNKDLKELNSIIQAHHEDASFIRRLVSYANFISVEMKQGN